MDLSKAYDCINYDILLAKLEAYGFSHKSLAFLYSYLKDRKQRTKIGSCFSKWLELVLGIPQGSILGPLLFNIFKNDLFLFVVDTEICNFADDNTLYACDVSIEAVIKKLNLDVERINTWFINNCMVANPSKFQLMFLGTKETRSIFIKNLEIKPQNEVELLGIKIDDKLNFRSHINSICNKANYKVSELIRLRKYMNTQQAKLIVNTYILPYFLYCPLIWMFCRKNEMNRINKVHKRALKAVYNNYPTLSYDDYLQLDNSICFHKRHLQLLMLEVFKSTRHETPLLVEEIFCFKKQHYNLRNKLLLKIPAVKSKTYGTNSLFFKASIIWNTLPNEYKTAKSIPIFKTLIKSWKGDSCSCFICA